MKLEKIEIQILEFPPHARYKDGVIPPGRPATWQYPLITLHTDDGLVGHSMIYGPHGDGPGMADILLKTYWPEIVGKDPRDTEGIWKRLMRKQRDLYNLSHTLTGVVDVALWDIKAKAVGLPVYKLLGEVRNKMPCDEADRWKTYIQSVIEADGGIAGNNYNWRQLYDPLTRYCILTYVIETDSFKYKHKHKHKHKHPIKTTWNPPKRSSTTSPTKPCMFAGDKNGFPNSWSN